MRSDGKHKVSIVTWPMLLVSVSGLLLISLFIAGVQYWQHSRLIQGASDALFAGINQRVQQSLNSAYRAPVQALNMLALENLDEAYTLDERLVYRDKLARVLIDNPHVSSIHVGWSDGDFLLLRPLLAAVVRDRVDAPDDAVWLLWHVQQTEGERHVEHHFYDQEFNLIDRRALADPGFDPRTRPWYDDALASATHSITGPYVFYSTSEFGTTVARTAGLRTVVAADITLDRLSYALSGHGTTPSSELLVYDSQGAVLAYQDARRIMNTAHGSALSLKTFHEMGSTLLAALADDGYTVERQTVLNLEGQEWIVMQQRLNLLNRKDIYLAVLIPQSELLNDAFRIRRESFWISLFSMLVLLALLFVITLKWVAFRHLSNNRRHN